MHQTVHDHSAPADLRRRRLAQVRARDDRADGTFWCSVITTGVYCRPSCPSRHARDEHIRFHDTLAEARRTGFRPCLRCRPEDPGLKERRAQLVDRACRVIRARPFEFNSRALARALDVSPAHLHRIFKAVTGVTPGAYARQVRERAWPDKLAA